MRLLSSLSLLALSLAACTGSDPSADPTGGSSGGKADDATSTAEVMPELSEEDQQYLRAADAECLHVHTMEHETYPVLVKMFCMPHGGAVAPITTYVAAVSPGEIGAVYKVYAVPQFMSELPTNVAFHTSGSRATLTYDFQIPEDIDAADFQYRTESLTVTLELSGDADAPSVVAKYSSSL